MATEAPSAAAATRTNPYVGPRALEAGELLFGRDDEVVDLLNQLIADRVVLLYAVSGAGKTSLIRAGLLPGLEARGFAPLPVVQVRDEPPPGLAGNRYLLSVLQRLEVTRPAGDRLAAADLAGMTLRDYLRDRVPAAAGGRVLVFDQFEDVLRIDPTDADVKAAFFKEVGAALREAGLWAVFSMREEYVAGLDPYLPSLPTRLTSRFRLALLSPKAAREAVCGPAEAAGVPFVPEVAKDVVKQLCRVQVQRADGRVEPADGSMVEPVQLQVVCQLLWERKPADAAEIGADALTGFTVDQALEQYYEGKVAAAAREAGADEARVRRWVEDRLITAQRLRGQVLKGPAETAGLANGAIDGLVGAYLVRAEPRLGGTWFELTHDRLVDPVRQNNRKWLAPRLQPFQLQADQWAARPEGERGNLLLGAVALADADRWVTAHPGAARPLDEEFLNKSRGARTTRDRIRMTFYRWWAALSTAAVATLVGLAWYFWTEGKKAGIEAQAVATENRAAAAAAEYRANLAAEGERNAKVRESVATEGRQQFERAVDAMVEQYVRLLGPVTERASKLATATTAAAARRAGEEWLSLSPPVDPADPAAANLKERFKKFQGVLQDYLATLTDSTIKADALGRITFDLTRKYRQASLPRDPILQGMFVKKLRALIYPKAISVTAELARGDGLDTPVARDLAKQFWELYWGDMVTLEDGAVETAMVEYGEALKRGDLADLRRLAPDVEAACRKELK